MINYPALQHSFVKRVGTADTLDPRAQKLFQRALRSSRIKKLAANLIGRSRELHALAAVRGPITSRHDAGTQTVSLDQIQGSLDKTDAFDIEFYPIHERSVDRWVSVATAALRGVSLPPIELIEVDGIYFVVDGHHRISVARALDQTHIDATVIVWEITT